MPATRRLMASILETLSLPAASTNCRTTPRSSYRTSLRQETRAGTTPRRARVQVGAAPREPVSPVYSPAGCDLVAHGCHSLGGSRRLYATSGFRIAGSGLSDHSGAHVLSRRKPERGRDHGNRAARAPIRRNAGLEPDDLKQLWRHVRNRSAV